MNRSGPRIRRRDLRRVAAALPAVLLISLVAVVQAPSALANGTTLLNETFTGASVGDPKVTPLNDACLTGAPAGSTPPAGASTLGPCPPHSSGSPTAGVTPGLLQLTDSENNRTGGMVYNRALPSSAGLQVQFDQAQYGGNGADGIGFFLTDGSQQLTNTGAIGGALGYGQRLTMPGVVGGYLGVGLDAFGSFITNDDGLGVAGCPTQSPFTYQVPNTVTLRGPGNGLQGYCFLTSTATLPGSSTLPGSLRASTSSADAAVRNVLITLSAEVYPTVTVSIDFTGTRSHYQTVLQYRMPDAAPATYKFGFSASTGSLNDVHLVRNLSISSIDSLGDISLVKQVDRSTAQPAAYGYGDTVPYQFVVTNTGLEAISDIAVGDPLVTNISCPSTTLGPAGGPTGSMVCTGLHQVTGTEATHPTLTNNTSVSARTSTGQTVTDTSTAIVDITEAQPRLSLAKSAHLNDTNGNGLADLGETIAYSYLLTNTGNVPLTGVGVNDPKAGPVTCLATTLAPSISTTCTAALYTVTEADQLAGAVVNHATGQATPPAGVPAITPPTDSVSTPTPVPAGGLSLVKSAHLNDTNGNGLADLGETIDYSFVLTNIGNVTLTAVGVTDPKAGTVTCLAATLSPGASTTCTAGAYTVTEADLLAGGATNTATGHGTPPAGVPAITPPTYSVTTPTHVPAGGLSLVKSARLNDTNGNNLADPGETIDYGFTLHNTGNVTLTAVGVTDPKAGTVSCLATTLAPGASTTCTVGAYTVTEADLLAGGVTNTAAGQATPPAGVPAITPPTDSVTTPTPVPAGGLSLVKSAQLNDTNGNNLADPGETIDYSFTLHNTGNVTLTAVGVTDPKAGTVTCLATTLAPGATTTCTAGAYTVTEADLLAGGATNTATGHGTPPAGVPAITPPTDTVTTPTPVPAGGLSLVKSAHLNDTNGNGLADVGETIDYSFALRNTGNVTLTAVGVTDPKAGTVTCLATTLAPGTTTACTAGTYTVTDADLLAGEVTNTATGHGTPPAGVNPIDPPSDTNHVPTPVAGAGMTLVKSARLNDTNGNGLADPGETIDYSFALTNNGTLTLTAVGVTDPEAGTVTCLATVLAPGASTTCTAGAYTVTEADLISGAVTNTATGHATPPPGEPFDPPTDTVTTPTSPAAGGLSLVKSAHLNDTNGNGLADVGETIDYHFALTNTGNVTLTGVGVTDPKAGPVTCLATTLTPSVSTTCTAGPYTVTDADLVTGTIVNHATGHANPPNGVPAITPPSDTTTTPTPVPAAGLSLVKSAQLNDTNGNGLADVGETIDYSFELTNTGDVTLTGVGVTDPKAGTITCAAVTLAPGVATTCTAGPYTVTEADLVTGDVTNTATGHATPPAGVDPVHPPTDTNHVATPVPGAGLSLVKTAHLNDTTGNGLADVGETIDYSFVLTNIGNVTLAAVGVADPKAGAVACQATTLAPGATTSCTTAPYTVTEADLVTGAVTNTATGVATPPGGLSLAPPTDTATTATPVPAGGLALVKSAQLNDTNANNLADIGETIDYSFVLTNTGNVTLTSVGVADPRAGTVTCPFTTLTPGATTTCTAAPYTVTEADIVAGNVVNTATGQASTPAGVPAVSAPSDRITTATALPDPSMTLVKSAQLHDTSNRQGYADVGEHVTFTVQLTNTGNIALSDVGVIDHTAGAVSCPTTVLQPGANTVCTAATYVVSAADVAQGGVLNIATGHATTPPGIPPIKPPTDAVSVAAPPITFPLPQPAPPSTSPAPAGTPPPETPPEPSGAGLPMTGSPVLLELLLGLGLITGGALLLSRRRRSDS